MEKKFFECDCHGESFSVELDTNWFNDSLDKEFYFSFWQRGFCNRQKMSLKEKLKYIKFILFKGHPWTDEIVLSKEKALELADFLESSVEEDLERKHENS